MNILRPRRQHGTATIEFALVAMIFFTLLFGILELSRLLYVFNTVQEVTRRAAREASMHWMSSADTTNIKTLALFGGSSLPGGAEVQAANIDIDYLQANGNPIASEPADAADNLSACGDATRVASCVYTVRVTVTGVRYAPMMSLFGYLNFPLPPSQVTMHAESMGFVNE